MIVQALSGAMSMTGEPDGGPTRLGIPAGDLVAGMYAVIGILSAYVDRQRTGQGRWVDVAMLDGMLAMLSYQAVYSTVGGITPGRQGSRHDSIPTYRTFRGGDDRDLAVTANTERMVRALCAVLGVGHLVEEERFATPAARLAHREELWPLLEKAFTAAPAAVWVDRLNAAGIPAALITTVPEALQDARESGRGMVRRITHPDGRSVEVLGNPVAFHGEPQAPFRYPPALGADADDVLAGLLDLSADDIAALRASGAVGGAS
jgi:crotonobetainyl-CoA:carnitine CoA-transferase CaiB-like acyl-CoA transferase